MKKLYRVTTLILFTVLAVLLAACSSNSPTVQIPAAIPAEDLETDVPQQNESANPRVAEVERVSFPKLWVEEVPRLDEQGAVMVEIVPLNLNNPGQTLDFKVTLDTHSVDLSMDLADLATLETDTGFTVQAIQWDAPLGGHHVSGTLSFPAGVEGSPLLEGALKMTIRLVDVDASERVFAWDR